MLKFVIAIDGPSASGKGSLAKIIANHFALPYLNSGALYRAFALLLLKFFTQNNQNFTQKELLLYLDSGLFLDQSTKIFPILINQIAVIDLEDKSLFTEEIGAIASKIAKLSLVRQLLFDFQQNFIQDSIKSHGGAVADGRDIASVIYPQADFKFFIQASPEIRAFRRFKQLHQDIIKLPNDFSSNQDYQLILKQIQDRDYQDYNRQIAPLKILPDSIIINNDSLPIDLVAKKMIDIISNNSRVAN